ncbi:MAG TPA: GNAT family N-acetyltransferase [Aggregatilineales bacterium]|nr:GNAT family N-acetyltransferase [Aggregatilineales bacterium]
MFILHDRAAIARLLVQNTPLHIYELGDLDDFFWPHTTWYTESDQVVLLYSGTFTPVVLALSDNLADLRDLVRSVKPLLPRSFHAHLSGGLADLLTDIYIPHPYGLHHKMLLKDRSRIGAIDTSGIISLHASDLEEVYAFYRLSYPGNFFDPRMLETGCYYGLRRNGQLISVGGIHVYSPAYHVAALGNVTTHPDFRGQGYATTVCARICREILPVCDHIGLNVKADNASAIAAYQKLGFCYTASYLEYDFEIKPVPSVNSAGMG